MGCVLLVEKHLLSESEQRWKLRSSYKMMFNSRWIGTERQAPDIRKRPQSGINGTTRTSHRNLKDIAYWSSRIRRFMFQSERITFLSKRLLSAFMIYGFNCLWQLVLVPRPFYYRPLEYTDVCPSKQTYIRRISDVTGRETIIRTALVFNFVWSAWALFTGLHDILAFVFVGIGLDEPQDWPPLFGSLSPMYTLRGFWGKFWHRLVYWSYTSYFIIISEKLFRLSRGSVVGRALINFTVFFLSGIVHTLVIWKLGFTCGYWEEISWFCLNFLAIFMEEGIQWVSSKYFLSSRKGITTRKIIGFLWVFSFFSFVTTKSLIS
jgi:hypothetical protein